MRLAASPLLAQWLDSPYLSPYVPISQNVNSFAFHICLCTVALPFTFNRTDFQGAEPKTSQSTYDEKKQETKCNHTTSIILNRTTLKKKLDFMEKAIIFK